MADIKSPEERSRNMAAIKSKDTKPEVYLRKLLFAEGIRFRKNVSYIYGQPDLWLAKYNTAIFIHGCFWHRHKGCKYAYIPKSREEFWNNKFSGNILRDKAVKEELEHQKIKQLIIWECTIKQAKKNSEKRTDLLKNIYSFLLTTDNYMEL